MASKKILGLTVQIGASHTELDKALQSIRKESKNLSDDLKTVNQQLKFDPKNPDLLRQKMDLLAKTVKNTEDRAETYRKAQESVNKALAEGKITAAQAENEVEKYASKIREAGNESKRTKAELDGISKGTSQLAEGFKNAASESKLLSAVIKGNLISSAVTGGLRLVGNLVKGIATGLWNGARAAASWTVNFGKAAIESGAAMRETLGTTERVFGADVLNSSLDPWARAGYKTMGLTRTGALDLANQTGNLLINKGLTEQQAAEMSKQLVQRAADLGANYNKSTEEAMSYFLSMLKGTYSSADAIGVVTNASAVTARAQQNALEGVDTSQIYGYEAALKDQEKAQVELNKAVEVYGAGSEEAKKANDALEKASDKVSKMLKKYTGEIGDAEKALAAYQIMLEQTAKSEGTYADEAKGWNGLKKTLQARLGNVKDDIGDALLPAAESILSTFSDYLTGEKGQTLISRFTEFLSGLSGDVSAWIENGGFEDLSAKIEEIFTKITNFLSPEKQAEISAWIDTQLPAAVSTATDALQAFIDFCGLVVDAYNNLKKTVQEVRAFFDDVKSGRAVNPEIVSDVNAAISNGEVYTASKSGAGNFTAESGKTATASKSGRGRFSLEDAQAQASALIGANQNLERAGTNLNKSEDKITKDAEDFSKETPAAMSAAVSGAQSAANKAGGISFGAWWAKLAEFTSIRKSLENEAYLASQVSISGTPTSYTSSSSSSGGSISSKVSSVLDAVKSNPILSKFITKKNAVGGVEISGLPYLVGEAGPELFVPSVNGRVLDHMTSRDIIRSTVNNNSGGNITLHQTINVSGAGAANVGQKAAADFIHALQKKGINPTRI